MRAAWILLLAAACTLSARSAPLELRYFSPEAPGARAATATAAAADAPEAPDAPGAPAAPRARLRLGRVTPSAHLRSRIVRRTSSVELRLSETRRWTETPDAYVRRSLARALFEARGLERVVGGAAPTLEVEVIAFEVVHHPDRRAGRVELRYQLHDERTVLSAGDVAIEREARGQAFELVVAAVGEALEAATAELADRVARRVCP